VAATVDHLEAGLDDVRAAPADHGTLELIVRRPSVDEREVVEEGELDPACGLVGDSWSKRGRSPNPKTQLTLMNARATTLVAGERERWPLAGDQLYVDLDLSAANMPPGTRLAIGSAIVEVSDLPHLGCHKFAARYGAEAREFVNSPVGVSLNLRGINARVVQRGTVRPGDVARKLPAAQEVAAGLWLWRVAHPDWRQGLEWEPLVTSTFVEAGGETVLIDPLAPPPGAREVWERLDARPPTVVVVLKPDHVRDVDLFVRRYGARAFGPRLFFRHDIPRTELKPIEPGDQLPGGLVALYDGRDRNETPVWVPEQRALVFADALTAPAGELRVWATNWYEERTLPALRELLELPFEHVIVSHGEPAHTREAYERALELPPWSG
jgi:MOSC domain-containing protein YiiM